jgi:putative ABC transport system ATP-binding protein
MIELKNIKKSYPLGAQSLVVLEDFQLLIREGEFVSIMGASGSGKSTLLNILGLLDDYDSGEYLLAGNLMRSLSEAKSARYRNQFIGFVFQSFNLIPFKRAWENVALPLQYKKTPRRLRKKLSMEALDRVGMTERAEHFPAELSGGQKQRVAIARALVTEPQVVFADEPTGNLDSQTSHEVMDLFSTIHRQGKTLIIVTHEEDIARRTERLVHLSDGKIVEDIRFEKPMEKDRSMVAV